MKREYISPIFIRQKPDSSYRLILNLKKLNENMPYIHFKMETFQSILLLITPGVLLGITGPEGYLLLWNYKHRSHQGSKIHLEKSIVSVFSTSKWSMLWSKKMYKIDETTHSYLDIAIYIDDLINVGLTFDEYVENAITSIKLLNSKICILTKTENSIFRV